MCGVSPEHNDRFGGVLIGFITLTGLVFTLRLVSRIKTGSMLGWEDLTGLAAVVCQAMLCFCQLHAF